MTVAGLMKLPEELLPIDRMVEQALHRMFETFLDNRSRLNIICHLSVPITIIYFSVSTEPSIIHPKRYAVILAVEEAMCQVRVKKFLIVITMTL